MKKLLVLVMLSSCAQTYVHTKKRCAPMWPFAVDATVGGAGLAVAVDGHTNDRDAQVAAGLATFVLFAVSAGWACSR
jgi:hypothetical protein